MQSNRSASLGQSVFVFVFLTVSLLFTIFVFEAPPHIPLLVSTAVAAAVGGINKILWSDMQESIAHAYAEAAGAILIMLLIGAIIGTWIIGGIVPTLIYFGLKVLSPDYFLLASCLICSVVSVATGSSWTTIGTVGLALAGIGEAMGATAAITVGAIVSGAYFGDKMSPLSDTTNLAPAIVGVNLFEHIRHLVYTTGPAYLVTLALFGAIDLSNSTAATAEEIQSLSNALDSIFNLSPVLLLVPLFTIVMIAMKTPAVPGLFIIAILGGLSGLFFQGAAILDIVVAMNNGYSDTTGIESVDRLLNRGGIQSMMVTVSLILIGLAFAGVAERVGIIKTVTNSILSLAKSKGALVFSTIVTTIFTAMTTGVQYVTLIIPGRLFRDVYPEYGLHRKNLSRAIEDSGTVVSPLIPWSTDGAFIAGVLGVSAFSYLPFAFFSLLSPIASAIAGFTGWSIAPVDDDGGTDTVQA